MKTLVCALAITVSAAPLGLAAQAREPVSDGYRSVVEMVAGNLIAAAEEMPADKYVFKPTPAQMSVGEVLVHLVEDNDILCSTIGSVPAPKRSPVNATDPKDELVAQLKESFQFCHSALAQTGDLMLADTLPFFRTRARAMFLSINHWADHYSQMAIYLRLNALLPPMAERRAK